MEIQFRLNYEEISVEWETLKRNPLLFDLLIRPNLRHGQQPLPPLSFDLGTDDAGTDQLLAEVLCKCLDHQCFPCLVEEITGRHADLDRLALTMRMWLVAQRFCMVRLQEETVRFMAALLHQFPRPKLSQVVNLLRILYQEAPPKLRASGTSTASAPSPRTRLWYGEARVPLARQTAASSHPACSSCQQAYGSCMITITHLPKFRTSH